jgi:hypothetical protein
MLRLSLKIRLIRIRKKWILDHPTALFAVGMKALEKTARPCDRLLRGATENGSFAMEQCGVVFSLTRRNEVPQNGRFSQAVCW